jgi:hypothetical protein
MQDRDKGGREVGGVTGKKGNRLAGRGRVAAGPQPPDDPDRVPPHHTHWRSKMGMFELRSLHSSGDKVRTTRRLSGCARSVGRGRACTLCHDMHMEAEGRMDNAGARGSASSVRRACSAADGRGGGPGEEAMWQCKGRGATSRGRRV